MIYYSKKELIYENKLSSKEDIKGFILEGDANISFENGKMRMENLRNAEEGQKSNFVFWCPKDFPKNIEINFDFKPIREPGLCILFFAAKGINSESIFDNKLNQRTGEYQMYHHGDINALHVSYFRRRYPEERTFHTCNLRKSYGGHLVVQGADPIPSVEDISDSYKIKLIKIENKVLFYIDDLKIFEWIDDGVSYGSILEDGKIGFRQMAPLIGEYSNLKVYEIE